MPRFVIHFDFDSKLIHNQSYSIFFHLQFFVSKKKKKQQQHCMKIARICSFPGTYFPVFELNAERYSFFLQMRTLLKPWKSNSCKCYVSGQLSRYLWTRLSGMNIVKNPWLANVIIESQWKIFSLVIISLKAFIFSRKKSRISDLLSLLLLLLL